MTLNFKTGEVKGYEVEVLGSDAPDFSEGSVAPLDSRDDTAGLKKTLKTRHLIWLSVGLSIGMGLWLGTGSSLSNGGPCSLIIGYLIASFIVCCVCQAVAELAILYPVASPFPQWCRKFLDPSAAVTLGFSYWFSFSIVLANELQGCTTTIGYWDEDYKVPKPAYLTIFLVVIIVINVFPVRVFAEVETVITTIKFLWMFVVIGACIYSSVHQHIGFHYWRIMPFTNGFKGFLSVLSTCVFALAGSELIGTVAVECKNPRRSLPPAANSVFARLGLFYIVGSLMATISVNPKDDALFGNGTHAAPYVLAFQRAGVPGLAHAMNVVILLSVISAGSAAVYASSRQLIGLARIGLAPSIFAKTDRSGRPWPGILSVLILGGGLCYLNASESGEDVFTWFSNLTSICCLWAWGSILLCHIRFRRAWKAQGRSLSELPWKCWSGELGSYVALILCILILIDLFYLSLFPLGEKPSAKNFFANFVALVILVFVYIAARLYSRFKLRTPMWIVAEDVDLDSGRMTYEEEQKSKPSVGRKMKDLITGKFI